MNSPKGKTQAQRAGLRYEAKVIKHLSELLPHFISHLPFIFYSDGVRERCIPDGLAFSEASYPQLTVIEIKHRHTADAWFQLNNLYLPVVRKAFPRHKLKLLEVCTCFDPDISIPAVVTQVDDLREWVNEMPTGEFGVYSWRDR